MMRIYVFVRLCVCLTQMHAQDRERTGAYTRAIFHSNDREKECVCIYGSTGACICALRATE